MTRVDSAMDEKKATMQLTIQEDKIIDILLHTATRSEMKEMGADIRSEMRTTGIDIRGEMKEMGTDIRKEMRDMGTDIRSEMKDMGNKLESKLDKLDDKLNRMYYFLTGTILVPILLFIVTFYLHK